MALGVFGQSLPKAAVGAMGDRRLQFGVDTSNKGCQRSLCLLQTSLLLCGGGGEGGGSTICGT